MDTIDNLFISNELECPHVIKADIEGHEMHLFLGSQKVLRECKPIILFEADCRVMMRSLLTLLDNLGYALAWVVSPYLDLTYEFNGYIPKVDGFGIYNVNFKDPKDAEWAVIGNYLTN